MLPGSCTTCGGGANGGQQNYSGAQGIVHACIILYLNGVGANQIQGGKWPPPLVPSPPERNGSAFPLGSTFLSSGVLVVRMINIIVGWRNLPKFVSHRKKHAAKAKALGQVHASTCVHSQWGLWRAFEVASHALWYHVRRHAWRR